MGLRTQGPHMRVLLVVLLVAALAFAGCTSNATDDDGEPTSSSTSSSRSTSSSGSSTSATGTSTSTTSTSPSVNRAPVANLTGNLTSGLAPLRVNFTLNATDADRDALTWVLSFGDASTNATGSSLPVAVQHTFDAGTFNVTLTVSDGTANDTVLFVLTVSPASAGGQPVVLSGEVVTNCGTQEFCYVFGAPACIGWNLMQQGIDCVWFELAAPLIGLPFATDSAGDIDLEFRSDCTPIGESVAIHGADGQESGMVPAGAGCVVLMDYLEGGVLTITIG